MARILGAALLFLPLLAGCHERRQEPGPSAAQVRERADQAQKNAADAQTQAAPESRPTPAPEAAPAKARVLNADTRGCTWLESEGVVTVGEDESRHQVRATAVNEARRIAMQDFLGVHVRSRFMDFQQEGLRDQKSLTESLLLTTRQGRILDEEILSEGYRDLAGCVACRYGVKLKACILPSGADSDFIVDLGLSRNRLVAGDEVKLNLTATRDCYVYVYDLWLDWRKVSMIVPNDRVPEVRLKAGQTWEYPDESARKAGVAALVAELPEGFTVSAETVRVVASKTPLSAKITDPSQGFLAILRRMNAGRLEWAEDAQAFTIYKK